jgi:hypothetical protein
MLGSSTKIGEASGMELYSSRDGPEEDKKVEGNSWLCSRMSSSVQSDVFCADEPLMLRVGDELFDSSMGVTG